MHVRVIFENDEVAVADKPSGLVVHAYAHASSRKHADGKAPEPTLVEWALARYPEIAGVGETQRLSNGEVVARPGIVHRLDRETSGVIVIAKTRESFLNLKTQFQKRQIEKTYAAFVYGVLKPARAGKAGGEDIGVIDKPIGRSAKDFRQWSAQRGARGTRREAVTEYTVRKRGSEATYVAVAPKTGRTHQIRVHFKAIHHPVVCDKLYAPKHECILGFKRLALHAERLSFTLTTGERIVAEAPLPADFVAALENLI